MFGFKGIINWFKSEQDPLGATTGENTMRTSNTATILPVPGDKFALFAGGQTIGTYSRRRDAVRGATRRGLTVK